MTSPSRTLRGFGRLHQVDLVKEVVLRLRTRILSGEFGEEGELPTESKLSDNFGVSRTVAREAMRTLRAQGLVAVSRGRKPRVSPVNAQVAIESLQALFVRSDTSLQHLFEIRRLLEVEIAGLAAQRATDEDILAFQSTIDDLGGAKSLTKQMEHDSRFHELLAASTGNPLFQVLLSTVAPLLDTSRKTTLSRVGVEHALQGHVAILDAIRQRNTEQGRLAMLEHLTMAEEDLRPVAN